MPSLWPGPQRKGLHADAALTELIRADHQPVKAEQAAQELGHHRGSRRGSDWYTTLEEGARIQEKQYARYKAQDSRIREELGQAFKSIALKWVRRQPRMKSCGLEDIERMERVIGCDGRRYFEIRAKGKTYTLGR